MIITNSVLDALRTQVELIYGTAYEGTEVFWNKLATLIPNNTKSGTYAWKAMQTSMRKWVGPRVAQNLSEHVYQLINEDYEATVEISKNEIEDDNLGVFTGMVVPDLGFAAAKWPDGLLATLLQGGAASVGFDGVPLFDNSHPNFNIQGGATTYDNLHTANLDGTGFNTVRSTMVSILGENGKPLGIRPKLVIVPPQLEINAAVLANSAFYALPNGTASPNGATIENQFRGQFDFLVVPELANEPNVWYLADVSRPIKPFVFQQRQAPELVSRQDPTDPKVFDRKMFTYGVDSRGAMGISLPFLIAKATHTPG